MNINWRDYTPAKVTPERFNKILDGFEKIGMEEVRPAKGHRLITKFEKIAGKYFFTNEGNKLTLYAAICFETVTRRVIWKPVVFTTRGEGGDGVTGKMAFFQINSRFRRLSKLSLYDAYGGKKENKAIYWLVKRCVPAPICWANEPFKLQILQNCYKVDVSSAYPFEASKRLPTMNGAKFVDGIAEPTEEFPFAFYPNAGTLKIYGEKVDTGELMSRPEYDKRRDPLEPLNKIITILCPAYEGNELETVFKDLYSKRDEHPEYKSFMNLCIGYCQMNKCPILSPIAAVTLARCCCRMATLADELKRRGNMPLMINVDSVSWLGKPEPDLYVPEKDFGAMVLEYKNVYMCIGGAKKFQIYDPETSEVVTKYAGVSTKISQEMGFGFLTNETPETEMSYEKMMLLDGRLHSIEVDSFDVIHDKGRY